MDNTNREVITSPPRSPDLTVERKLPTVDTREVLAYDKLVDGVEHSDSAKYIVRLDLVAQPLHSVMTENEGKEDAVPKNTTSYEEVRKTFSAIEVPPHLRPEPHSRPEYEPSTYPSEPCNTRHASSPEKNIYGNGKSQAPRESHTRNGSRHNTIPSEPLARIQAQLLKVKNELEAERDEKVKLRQLIESEQRQKLEAAYSTMLANLLHEQTEALALKSEAEAKKRDLETREAKISDYEAFLCEGQRVLFKMLGESAMMPKEKEHMRRQLEIDIRNEFSDREAEIEGRKKMLRLRAEAQDKREEQYKLLLREELKAEMSADQLFREKADKIAKEEHHRGYEEGKESGHEKGYEGYEEAEFKKTESKEASEAAIKKAFLEGYRAFQSAQARLSGVRRGVIAPNSPDLDLLFDPGHPNSMFNMGVEIGKLESQEATISEPSAVIWNPFANNWVHPSAISAPSTTIPEIFTPGVETKTTLTPTTDCKDESECKERSEDENHGNNTSKHMIDADVDAIAVIKCDAYDTLKPIAAPAPRIPTWAVPLQRHGKPTLAAELRGKVQMVDGGVVLNQDFTRAHLLQKIEHAPKADSSEGPDLIDFD